jgi:uracil-DNA glycosylase
MPLQAPLSSHFDALPQAWQPVVQPFIHSPACAALCAHVDARIQAGAIVLPATPFAALHMTAPAHVRVVILGQDPYHGVENGIAQAHGFSFSVPHGVAPPPSLRNIFKEIARSTGACVSNDGDLTRWAQQGVLLLNAVLTVEKDKPTSHAKLGWEVLTDHIIAALGAADPPKVFMLWGTYAQKKAALIGAQHLSLTANHPSPLAALRPPQPFIGCGHFSRANEWLQAQRLPPVQW